MKKIIRSIKNIFSKKKTELQYYSCGCNDCKCARKTYVVPVGALSQKEAEESLRETIKSFKQEVVILPISKEKEIKISDTQVSITEDIENFKKRKFPELYKDEEQEKK